MLVGTVQLKEQNDKPEFEVEVMLGEVDGQFGLYISKVGEEKRVCVLKENEQFLIYRTGNSSFRFKSNIYSRFDENTALIFSKLFERRGGTLSRNILETKSPNTKSIPIEIAKSPPKNVPKYDLPKNSQKLHALSNKSVTGYQKLEPGYTFSFSPKKASNDNNNRINSPSTLSINKNNNSNKKEEIQQKENKDLSLTLNKMENPSLLKKTPQLSNPNLTSRITENKKEAPVVFHREGSPKKIISSLGISASGLKNFGNTCYINSVVQMLTNMKTFMKDLDEIEPKKGIVKSLCSLNREMKGEGVVNPGKLIEAVGKKQEIFLKNKQEDAHELLSVILEGIHMDILEEKKSEECPVKLNFQIDINHEISCLNCGDVLVSKECYRGLSLDVLGDRTTICDITSLMERFFQEESITHECEKCKSTQAKMKYTIASLPRAIVIHLKRFQFMSGNYSSKISTIVNLNSEIDLGQYCTEDLSRPSPVKKPVSFEKSTLSKRKLDFDSEFDQANKKVNLSPVNMTEEQQLEWALKDSKRIMGSPESQELRDIQKAIEISKQELGESDSLPEEKEKEKEVWADKAPVQKSGKPLVTYKLSSVISHLGVFASNGHYICDVKEHSKSVWRRYNDELVFDLQSFESSSKNVYLLLYEHES